jgi:hypothetical protein
MRLEIYSGKEYVKDTDILVEILILANLNLVDKLKNLYQKVDEK